MSASVCRSKSQTSHIHLHGSSIQQISSGAIRTGSETDSARIVIMKSNSFVGHKKGEHDVQHRRSKQNGLPHWIKESQERTRVCDEKVHVQERKNKCNPHSRKKSDVGLTLPRYFHGPIPTPNPKPTPTHGATIDNVDQGKLRSHGEKPKRVLLGGP